MFRVVNEETRRTVENPATRALREGVVVGLANHTLLIAKDGTERPIDDSAAPIRCKEGELVGCVLVFRDITERKQAEEGSHEREERFRRTMMEVAVPTLLHAEDDEILLVNRAWTDTTGYRIEDIPTIGDWTLRAYGERHATAKQFIDKLFESDARLDNGEWEVTTVGGEKRVWHFFSTPVGRERSGRRLPVSNAIDITERKRAEERLRQAEEQFRTLADNIPQLAWVADAGTEGQVHWFNQNWFGYTGTTHEEMRGSGWHSVHHPDHAERVIQKFAHHVRQGLDWEDTFPLRGRDGEYRWFLSRMKCIKDESGLIVRIFGTNTW